jgi:hypothetical protein
MVEPATKETVKNTMMNTGSTGSSVRPRRRPGISGASGLRWPHQRHSVPLGGPLPPPLSDRSSGGAAEHRPPARNRPAHAMGRATCATIHGRVHAPVPAGDQANRGFERASRPAMRPGTYRATIRCHASIRCHAQDRTFGRVSTAASRRADCHGQGSIACSCEGFRMPADRGGAAGVEGRRPKASREGTRGVRAGVYGDLAIADG